MLSTRPYLQHITTSADLVTTYEAARAGFVSLALERNRRATPYVEQARILKSLASKAKSPVDLLNIDGIRGGLVTAAGLSDKAVAYLAEYDKTEAIEGLIKNFLEPAGKKFVEELVYRFLLTRGDTLGGSMRNVGGFLAQIKLSRSLVANLVIGSIPYYWLDARTNVWIAKSENDADIERFMRGLSWNVEDRTRTLIFNVNVPIIKNNVDLCLFNCLPQNYLIAIKSPENYVALGELKGGIDPAGADEHWKTARTAIERIRKAFRAIDLIPHTFFVGAAIAEKMAREIWEELDAGILTNAANLTDDNQTDSLCKWLIML